MGATVLLVFWRGPSAADCLWEGVVSGHRWRLLQESRPEPVVVCPKAVVLADSADLWGQEQANLSDWLDWGLGAGSGSLSMLP